MDEIRQIDGQTPDGTRDIQAYPAPREAFIPTGEAAGAEQIPIVRFAYLAAALAVTVGAALASRRIFSAGILRDPFESCSSFSGALIAAGRLLCPTLAAYLAIFLGAFSPFAIPASLGALTVYGTLSGVSFFALADDASSGAFAPTPVCAVSAALYALSALFICVFAARSCELSPAARSVRFSTFDGRHEARTLTLSFFTLSGAAALLCTASALILHFGR